MLHLTRVTERAYIATHYYIKLHSHNTDSRYRYILRKPSPTEHSGVA